MDTKKILRILGVITVIVAGIYLVNEYLTAQKDKKPEQDVAPVVYGPREIAESAKTAQDLFYNLGVSIAPDARITTNTYFNNRIKLPTTANVYEYNEVTTTDLVRIANAITKSTGIVITDGNGELGKKAVYIDGDEFSVFYTNSDENLTKNLFPMDFVDTKYISTAEKHLANMGIDLTGYEYTKFAYFSMIGQNFELINTSTTAAAIKYTFENKVDNYPILVKDAGYERDLSVWLNSKGELLKMTVYPNGTVGKNLGTYPIKSLESIKRGIMNKEIRPINGDLNIIGMEIRSIEIQDAKIVYTSMNGKIIPLVKLEAQATTVSNDKGHVSFVINAIDMEQIK